MILVPACALEAEEDSPDLLSATVDFGSGPEDIVFEDRDGRAIFEGDMDLGPTDMVASGGLVLSPLPEPGGVAPASVLSFNGWPGGVVPYVKSANLSSTADTAFENARSTWNATGIVSFVPRTTQNTWIVIDHRSSDMSPTGGRAPVGFYPYTVRIVRLGESVSTRTATHELGHVLGLHHEQTRLDRDSNVRINWSNIPLANRHNFWTHSYQAADYGPYDINSLMHYADSTFAINGSSATIVPSGCSFTRPLAAGCSINPSSTPTRGDMRGILRIYAGAPFRLRNDDDRECLRPVSGSQSAGARITTDGCSSGSDSRRWHRFKPLGSSTEMLVNKISRLCLTAPVSGNRVTQEACTNSTRQRWNFISSNSGNQIRLSGTNRCLRKRPQDAEAILSTTCSSSSRQRRWHSLY